MAGKRPQKPRGAEEKLAQTMAAREARESQRGFTFAWLEGLFVSGMKQQQWVTRAEAARWLTKESESSAQIGGGVALCAWSDVSRGYSRDLFDKLRAWEIKHRLTYRPRGVPCPLADPDADASVFPAP